MLPVHGVQVHEHCEGKFHISRPDVLDRSSPEGSLVVLFQLPTAGQFLLEALAYVV
jgi:hypothetical protein